MSDLTVIVPVKDMAAHIEGCVSTLVPQLGATDTVVVVDDASSDDSALRAERAGATVLRNTSGKGPYAARNRAASMAGSTYLLFVDARCRARPGLLDAHRALLAMEGTAMSCTNVQIESRPSLAARIAVAQDFFRAERKVTGSHLDFYPTANLGVRASVFAEVGGFRGVRSGADADLCWRIQDSGAGRLTADFRALMSWVPRDRLRSLWEQNYRYGKSSVFLEHLHHDLYSRVIEQPERVEVASPDVDRAAELGAKVIMAAFRAGTLRGRWEYRSGSAANLYA